LFSPSPITRRRWAQFKANKRGFWSLGIFLAFFVLALSANLVANSRPLLVSYKHTLFFPTFVAYPEKTFGGDFETETEKPTFPTYSKHMFTFVVNINGVQLFVGYTCASCMNVEFAFTLKLKDICDTQN
jgi:ABC-type microcin C transport system permease subunit YejE